MSDIYRDVASLMFRVPTDQVTEEQQQEVKRVAYAAGWRSARADRAAALERAIKAQQDRLWNVLGYHARNSVRVHLRELQMELDKLRKEEEEVPHDQGRAGKDQAVFVVG